MQSMRAVFVILFNFDSIVEGGHKVNLTSKLISIIKYCVFQLETTIYLPLAVLCIVSMQYSKAVHSTSLSVQRMKIHRTC